MKRSYCQTESGSSDTNQNAQENSTIPNTSSSKDKQISAPNDPSNDFRLLNEDVAREIASHSSVNQIVNLMSVSKTTYHLFRPNLQSSFTFSTEGPDLCCSRKPRRISPYRKT